jgi:hypothetical protein
MIIKKITTILFQENKQHNYYELKLKEFNLFYSLMSLRLFLSSF